MEARRPRVVVLLVVLFSALSVWAAPALYDGVGATVRFALYGSLEARVVTAAYAEGVRLEGIPVSYVRVPGGPNALEDVLRRGEVDVAVGGLGADSDLPAPEAGNLGRTAAELAAALRSRLRNGSVLVLDYAQADTRIGFVVTNSFAASHKVSQLSDLVPLATSLTLGETPECRVAASCLPGLAQVYGLRFGAVRDLPSSTTIVDELLANRIQVGEVTTSDAGLSDAGIALLGDDRALEPPDNFVPLIRARSLARWGGTLEAILNSISARLTTAELINLNRQVSLQQGNPAAAVVTWWSGG